MPRIVLIGPPGSGKSTVGRRLGELLGTAWRDSDAEIEARAGKKVADIFIEDGEPAFRELERHVVAELLELSPGGVVSLGGGAVMDPATEARIEGFRAEGGVVVFLDVTLAAAAPRVGLNQSRPLLVGNPRQRWLTLMEERRPVYEGLATLTVLTDNRAPRDVAREIADKVDRAPGAVDRATGAVEGAPGAGSPGPTSERGAE